MSVSQFVTDDAHRAPRIAILVVEDDAVVAQDICETLAAAGYAPVGPADSGASALAMAASDKVQLVLMDIRLRGDVDGIDVAHRLWRELMMPSVFVTAVDCHEQVAKAAYPGALGYVVKPFEPRQLLATVQLALEKSTSERERLHEMWRQGTIAEAYARIVAEVDNTRRTLERIEGPVFSLAVPASFADLSARERQVLQLLLSSHRVPTIAELLFISQHTVRNHLKSIFRKVGVNSQVELIERVRHDDGQR